MTRKLLAALTLVLVFAAVAFSAEGDKVKLANGAMGGVDGIIFTAGVGENSAAQRMDIASGLEFMGVKMDGAANKVRGKEAVISAPDSRVKVLLIPTNEELMIALDTAAIVKG